MTESVPGDATRLLAAIGAGQRHATEELFALVYDELRRLAERRLSREDAGDQPHPTSLVHEVYLRLLGAGGDVAWDHHGHFFAAAAEAMRRILVERARRRRRARHGGGRMRVRLTSLSDHDGSPKDEVDLVALDDAMARLQSMDTRMSDIVKLRFFAGLTIEQTALALGVSDRTVERDWLRARAWLLHEIGRGDGREGGVRR